MFWRYQIKNYRGMFTIMIALDFGQRGGCCADDYTPIRKTAWAMCFPEAAETFEFVQQAQYALDDLKEGLKFWANEMYKKRIAHTSKPVSLPI